MYDLFSAKLLNGELEQLVCWPVYGDLRRIDRFRATIDSIAENSPFTAVILAHRSNESEPPIVHTPIVPDQASVLNDAVAYAHSKGLKFGIEVATGSAKPTELRDMQGVAVHTISSLQVADLEQGRKQVPVRVVHEVPVAGERTARVQEIRLLKTYVYRRVDWCHFKPGSLMDITDLASLSPAQSDEAVVSIRVESDKWGLPGAAEDISAASGIAQPGLNEYVVHTITVHYYDYPSIWSGLACEAVESVLKAYAQANLDGAILRSDSVCLRMLDTHQQIDAEVPGSAGPCTSLRRQWYCDAMSTEYNQATGRSLEEDLLYMTVAPADDDGLRSRALTDYFDLYRSQSVRLKRAMYDAVKNAFGEDAFVASYIDQPQSVPEEIWRNGLSKWDEKSDFAQVGFGSDAAIGLALARKWGSRVWYSSYCNRPDLDLDRASRRAADIAKAGGRVHYEITSSSSSRCDHSGSTAVDEVSVKASDIKKVSKIENKMRLLNWFQAEPPESGIVVVMGYPEMIIADKPDTEYGMNSRCAAGFETARLLQSMGYSCDVVPSYEIDDNDLRICCSGGLHYGLTGSYRLLVYVLPEYSKPSTLDFLDRYLDAGGKLVLVGDCTKDVNGNDVSERFARLRYSAVAAFGQTVFADSDKALLESTLSQLKIKPNDITNGTRFNHREVVLVQEYSEILCDTAVSTEFAVDGHTVSAEFCGVLAVRLCKDGGLERLAASGLSSLQLDGTDVFRFDAPRDVLAHRAPHAEDEMLVVYPSESMVPSAMACPKPGRA